METVLEVIWKYMTNLKVVDRRKTGCLEDRNDMQVLRVQSVEAHGFQPRCIVRQSLQPHVHRPLVRLGVVHKWRHGILDISWPTPPIVTLFITEALRLLSQNHLPPPPMALTSFMDDPLRFLDTKTRTSFLNEAAFWSEVYELHVHSAVLPKDRSADQKVKIWFKF